MREGEKEETANENKRKLPYNGLSANAKGWLLAKYHFATSSIFQQHVKGSAPSSLPHRPLLSPSPLPSSEWDVSKRANRVGGVLLVYKTCIRTCTRVHLGAFPFCLWFHFPRTAAQSAPQKLGPKRALGISYMPKSYWFACSHFDTRLPLVNVRNYPQHWAN